MWVVKDMEEGGGGVTIAVKKRSREHDEAKELCYIFQINPIPFAIAAIIINNKDIREKLGKSVHVPLNATSEYHWLTLSQFMI